MLHCPASFYAARAMTSLVIISCHVEHHAAPARLLRSAGAPEALPVFLSARTLQHVRDAFPYLASKPNEAAGQVPQPPSMNFSCWPGAPNLKPPTFFHRRQGSPTLLMVGGAAGEGRMVASNECLRHLSVCHLKVSATEKLNPS